MHFSAICLKVHCPFKKCITKCMSSDTRGTEEYFMNLLLLNNICSDDETSYILLILHLSTTRYILLLLNEGIFLIKFIYKLKKKNDFKCAHVLQEHKYMQSETGIPTNVFVC